MCHRMRRTDTGQFDICQNDSEGWLQCAVVDWATVLMIAKAACNRIQLSGETDGNVILPSHSSQAAFHLSAKLIIGFLLDKGL